MPSRCRPSPADPPVTLEEAAAILQITLPCARSDARKAYLRLVKVHKPDRAPEEFRRVREAWERLENLGDPIAAWLGGPATASMPVPAAPVAVPVPPAPAPAPEAPAPAPEAPVSAVPELVVDRLGPFRARMDALPRGTDAEAYVAIAREAVDEHPDEPEAHWMLYEEQMNANREQDAVATLRAAATRGLGGFLDELAATHPSALEEHELLGLARENAPREPAFVAVELARRGRAEEALALALERLARSDASSAWLVPYHRMHLLLVQRGELERASRLAAALAGVSVRLGRGRGPAAIVGLPADAITAQLDRVAARMPRGLRALVVASLLDELSPHSLARLELEAGENRNEALRLKAMLEHEAPLLGALFGPSLGTAPMPKTGESSGSSSWGGGFGTIFLFVMVARAVVAAIGGSCEPDATPQLRGLPPIPAVTAPASTEPEWTPPPPPAGADAGAASGVVWLPATPEAEGAR